MAKEITIGRVSGPCRVALPHSQGSSGKEDAVARAAGLEPQQYMLLLALRGLPAGVEATIRTLADRLALRHHSAVELIDRLEDAWLRAPEPQPGRPQTRPGDVAAAGRRSCFEQVGARPYRRGCAQAARRSRRPSAPCWRSAPRRLAINKLVDRSDAGS